MNTACQHVRLYFFVALIAWGLAALGGVMLYRARSSSLAGELEAPRSPVPARTLASRFEASDAVFATLTPGRLPASATDRTDLRFRLAGTFLSTGDIGMDTPRAILDDRQLGRQRVVRPGEMLGDGMRVERIGSDYVLLTGPSGRVHLNLDMAASASGAAAADPAFADRRPLAGNAGNAWEEQFGARRVSDTRWEFSRDPLLRYYRELRDEPRRLLAVFDSMKPIYETDRSISGYRLEIEGEANFFSAVGLGEGDIVRAVNSVPMTNRRRAEHFIRRFVEDGLDTVVLEVERDGIMTKQEYLIDE